MTSIRRRLQAGFLVAIGFFALQTAIFYGSGSAIETDITATVQKNTQVSAKLSGLASDVQRIRGYEKEYFIYVADIEKRNGYVADWTNAGLSAEATMQSLQQNSDSYLTTTEVAQVNEWQQAFEFYKSEMQKIFARVNSQNSADAIAYNQKLPAQTPAAKPNKAAAPTPQLSRVELLSPSEVNAMIGPGKDRLNAVFVKGVAEMGQARLKDTLGLTGSIHHGFSQMAAIFLTVSLMGIALATFLLLTMPTLISTPIARLSNSVDLLSKGAIEQEIEVGDVIEFQPLAKGLERLRMAQSLLVERHR